MLLEIMHQDDALALLVELGHHGVDDLRGVLCPEVKGIEVAGKYRDVSGAEISHRGGAMLQFRETKERGGGGTQRQLDGAVAFFALVPGELMRRLLAIEVGMRPGVGANRMPGSRHLPEDLRMIAGVLADRKKHRLGAFVREHL